MRLVLCDSHRLLLEALSTALSARGWTVEATALNPCDAVEAVRQHDPDLLVTEVDFSPEEIGLDAVRIVTEQHTRTKVVILTDLDSPSVVRSALDLGVVGYTRKDRSIDAILEVMERVGQGEVAVDADLLRRLAVRKVPVSRSPSPLRSLTPRERRVVELLVDGRNTAEIVDQLRISDSTARTHVQSILTKLGVHSRVQAVALLHGDGQLATER